MPQYECEIISVATRSTIQPASDPEEARETIRSRMQDEAPVQRDGYIIGNCHEME